MSYTHSGRSPKKRRSATSKSRGTGSRSSKRSAEAVQPRVEDLKIHHGDARGVFYDICKTPQEAQHLTLRSELIIEIRELLRRRQLTQARAAKLFGVTQPRISDLMRGKIDLFSLDTLINMLTRAGVAVHLVVEQSAA